MQLDFPSSHYRGNLNILEKFNIEIKRQPKLVPVFPTGKDFLHIIGCFIQLTKNTLLLNINNFIKLEDNLVYLE